MSITQETKKASYEEIKKDLAGRQHQCLEALGTLKRATANELAFYMNQIGLTPSFNRNYVHPRLNELVKLGYVEVIGKKRDTITNKTTAVYQLKENY